MATIHVNRGGTNLGIFSEDEIRKGLGEGRFRGTDLAWREGMPSWQPLSQFSEFADVSASATPTPAAASATPPGAGGSVGSGAGAPPPQGGGVTPPPPGVGGAIPPATPPVMVAPG